MKTIYFISKAGFGDNWKAIRTGATSRSITFTSIGNHFLKITYALRNSLRSDFDERITQYRNRLG